MKLLSKCNYYASVIENFPFNFPFQTGVASVFSLQLEKAFTEIVQKKNNHTKQTNKNPQKKSDAA